MALFLWNGVERHRQQNLLKTVESFNSPVKVSIQKSNSPKDLKSMSELQIRDELKDQGVVRVHRVTFRKDGEAIITSTLFPDL